MTQPNDWQPELFTEFQAPSKPPWWARYWRVPQRFVVMRLAAEDLVLAAIAALMIMVLGFCLGVERGKRLIATAYSAPRQGAEESLPADRPGGTLPPPAGRPAVPSAPLPPARPPVVPQRPASAVGLTKVVVGDRRYVVQVASFTARDQATAAHTRLSQRGVPASLATKGKYHVLYAGGFATYAQATAAADRLRATYRDCFVRKLLADRG